MTYIPRKKVTDLIPNKFEAIRVAALEARRLNARARTLDVSLPGKITSLAVDRLLTGQVSWYDRREREIALQAEAEAEAEAAAAEETEE
jgi:DNA-directed RNA polymerase subunit K/omega